jgi:hypothetical protein
LPEAEEAPMRYHDIEAVVLGMDDEVVHDTDLLSGGIDDLKTG